jgi:hypothetical protein
MTTGGEIWVTVDSRSDVAVRLGNREAARAAGPPSAIGETDLPRRRVLASHCAIRKVAGSTERAWQEMGCGRGGPSMPDG